MKKPAPVAKVEKPAKAARVTTWDWMAEHLTADQRLAALAAAVDRLQRDWGTTEVPWGEVNRFQRTTADIVQPFSDDKPSIPVPFASARWGSLASFGAQPYPGTKRWYGSSGNSFVAVVEFGPKVRAWAVTAGGESGDPSSPHFNDQAARYAAGALRPVYFYASDLKGHVERSYHPGSWRQGSKQDRHGPSNTSFMRASHVLRMYARTKLIGLPRLDVPGRRDPVRHGCRLDRPPVDA